MLWMIRNKRNRHWMSSTGLAAALTSFGISPLALADDPQEKTTQSKQTQVIVTTRVEEDGDGKVKTTVEEKEVKAPKLWVGIQLRQVEGDLARHLGTEGVFIAEVYPDSPAAEAGLKEGDVLTTLGEKKLSEPSEVLEAISEIEEGESVAVEVLRRGEAIELKVTPKTRPSREELGLDPLERYIEVQSDDLSAETNKILNQIRVFGTDRDDVNVLRFGPSYVWRGDSNGDINVTVEKTVDGENLNITVTRSDDEPAKVKVMRGEDDVTEFEIESVDDIPEDLPEDVSKAVKDALSKSKNHSFEFRVGGKDGAMMVAPQEIELKAITGQNAEEMAVRIREMVEEQASQWKEQAKNRVRQETDRAREIARSARNRIQEQRDQHDEIQELRSLVESLKREIEELRSQLNSKDP